MRVTGPGESICDSLIAERRPTKVTPSSQDDRRPASDALSTGTYGWVGVVTPEEILLKVASFTVIVGVVGCHEDLGRRVDLTDLQYSTEAMCLLHCLEYFQHLRKEYTVASGQINPDWDGLQANQANFSQNCQFDLLVLDP